MGPFNNRELATAIWLLVFFAWVLRRKEVRKPVAELFRLFRRAKVIVPICLMIFYVASNVLLLRKIGLWDESQLKDTIVWLCFGAMAMMFRYTTADIADDVFRKIITDSIKVIILLEFLVNTYTFSLPVEFILFPLFAFIVMLDSVAGTNREYSIVSKLTQGIQVIAGFVILWVVINRAISDFQNLNSMETFRNILLAPLLSTMLFPFIYIMLLFSKYEILFLRLEFGKDKSRSLKRYARRKIIMFTGLSLKRLQYLLNNHVLDLMQIEKKSDVNNFLLEAKSADDHR